jgi:hypothetical protein
MACVDYRVKRIADDLTGLPLAASMSAGER